MVGTAFARGSMLDPNVAECADPKWFEMIGCEHPISAALVTGLLD